MLLDALNAALLQNSGIQQTINVTTLNGDAVLVPWHSGMRIKEIKEFLEKNVGTNKTQQRLMFKSTELKVPSMHVCCRSQLPLFNLKYQENKNKKTPPPPSLLPTLHVAPVVREFPFSFCLLCQPFVFE